MLCKFVRLLGSHPPINSAFEDNGGERERERDRERQRETERDRERQRETETEWDCTPTQMYAHKEKNKRSRPARVVGKKERRHFLSQLSKGFSDELR